MRILARLALGSKGGENHAERLEGFYHDQAQDYDDFRERLLPGRRVLFEHLERLAPRWNEPGGVPTAPECNGPTWVDLGGGTGRCLELIGERIEEFEQIYLVDLSPSLLAVAKERVKAKGWKNVTLIEEDASTFSPPGRVQLITCSYSLTMMPDWFSVVDNAHCMLAPGGIFAATDFYVSRRYPEATMTKHSWAARTFWPTWFGMDNVWLSADHLPFLKSRFRPEILEESRSAIPYMLGRVPFYVFIGKKAHAEEGGSVSSA